MKVSGGCLCGEVSYEISGPFIGADHCHCSLCRRQHGAAFATYADFGKGSFRWTSGESLVKSYELDSGGGWCFCSACGSSLAGTLNGEITSITLGTVRGDPGVRPGSHIFVDSKADWYEIEDRLPQHQERAEDG